MTFTRVGLLSKLQSFRRQSGVIVFAFPGEERDVFVCYEAFLLFISANKLVNVVAVFFI